MGKLKQLIIFSIFLIFYSCNQPKAEVQSRLPAQETYEPLFLNLSPKMTDNIFQASLIKLTKAGKLDANSFVILLNGEQFDFTIKKTERSIRLNCNKTIAITNSLNRQERLKIYRKENKHFENIALQFEKLFKTKYSIIDLPTSDFNSSEITHLYRDTGKIICLNYRKNFVQNPVDENKDLLGKEVVLSKLGEMYAKMELEKPAEYGLSISIEYFTLNDGEIFKSELLQKYQTEVQQEISRKQIEKSKESNLEKL